jgi:hypothetical protein
MARSIAHCTYPSARFALGSARNQRWAHWEAAEVIGSKSECACRQLSMSRAETKAATRTHCKAHPRQTDHKYGSPQPTQPGIFSPAPARVGVAVMSPTSPRLHVAFKHPRTPRVRVLTFGSSCTYLTDLHQRCDWHCELGTTVSKVTHQKSPFARGRPPFVRPSAGRLQSVGISFYMVDWRQISRYHRAPHCQIAVETNTIAKRAFILCPCTCQQAPLE